MHVNIMPSDYIKAIMKLDRDIQPVKLDLLHEHGMNDTGTKHCLALVLLPLLLVLT